MQSWVIKTGVELSQEERNHVVLGKMDWTGDHVSEIIQTEKGKFCEFSLICGIKKKDMKVEWGLTREERGSRLMRVEKGAKCENRGEYDQSRLYTCMKM
jgi:hypothetical protein